MRRISFITVVGLVLLGCLTTVVPAQPPDTAGRSKRYSDPMNGFSLRPPRGAKLEMKPGATDLARWVCRDEKTGKTFWTLSVLRGTSDKPITDIKAHAKTLTKEIESAAAGAKVESTRIVPLSGHRALVLTGRVPAPEGAAGKVDLHFHQAWFLIRPGRFLIVKWDVLGSCPAISETWKNILASLQITDPAVAIEKYKADKKRSEKLLWKDLTEAKLAAVLPAQPRWYLMCLKNRPVGWLCVQGGPARKDQISGYEIRSWAVYRITGRPIRLVRNYMFTDPKLKIEKWRLHVQIGSGPAASALVEDGVRQGGLVVVTLSDIRGQTNRQRKVPQGVMDIYLPKTVSMVLPRLLDLKQKAAYIFAEYAGDSNDFRMRTFTVVGPERVRTGEQWVQAVKATDRPTRHSEPVTLWLDEKGQLLRSEAPDGSSQELMPVEEILRIFPNARRELNAMKKAEARTRKHISVDEIRKSKKQR